MGQLLSTLQHSSPPSNSNDSDDDEAGEASNDSPLAEVKQIYVHIRNSLLLSFIQTAFANSSSSSIPSPSVTSTAIVIVTENKMTTEPLHHQTRSLLNAVLHLSELEHLLFHTLFHSSSSVPSDPKEKEEAEEENAVMSAKEGIHFKYSTEVENIIENLCSVAMSTLRPLIIKETSMDELSKLILLLTDGTFFSPPPLFFISLSPLIIAIFRTEHSYFFRRTNCSLAISNLTGLYIAQSR